MRENRDPILKTTLYAGAIFTVFFISLSATAIAQTHPDVNQPGPYAVGHSWYVFEDYRWTYNSEEPVLTPWPVPVYVFYPADPESIGESTPEAVYHLDLFFNYGNPLYTTTSDQWEEEGFEPAYQDPPASAESPFPLVIVSPGGGHTGHSMFYMGLRLASHGFTVAIIHHYNDVPGGGWSDYCSNFVNRTTDMSFALTKLLEKNGIEGETLHNVIDPNKVAAAGFSMGGTASLALASGMDDVCWFAEFAGEYIPEDYPCGPIYTDPRIKAVVSLDAASWVFLLHELNRITVPLLSIGEDWDALFLRFGVPAARSRLHAATSRAHPSYRIDVHGTDHRAFCNACETIPILVENGQSWMEGTEAAYCAAELPPLETKRIVTKYVIAFLKTNLVGEPGYENILTPGHTLTQESMVEFFETERRNPNAWDENFPDAWNYDSHIYFPQQPGYDEANAYKEYE